MQKPHNITHRKRLPWCELINSYNFFSLSVCFTIRHKKRFGETLKLPRLTRVSGASRSRPPSRKLQRLVSVSSRSLNVSSRSRLEQNFEGLGLVSVSETWVSDLVSVSAQKVSCTSLIRTFSNRLTFRGGADAPSPLLPRQCCFFALSRHQKKIVPFLYNI